MTITITWTCIWVAFVCLAMIGVPCWIATKIHMPDRRPVEHIADSKMTIIKKKDES